MRCIAAIRSVTLVRVSGVGGEPGAPGHEGDGNAMIYAMNTPLRTVCLCGVWLGDLRGRGVFVCRVPC